MSSRRRRAALVTSHLCAAALGVAGGYAWDLHLGRVANDLTGAIARSPLSMAADLAFRFGTPEHARILVSQIPISASDDLFHWGDLFVRDLRLVVLCREMRDTRCAADYLASAADACRHLLKKNCSLDYLGTKGVNAVGKHRTASTD
jgi:hypothetical protein